MPRLCGTLISAKMATPVELQRDLGVKDSYDLLELLGVDAHNYRVLHPPQKAR